MKPIFGLLLSCAVVIGCLAKRPQTQTLERGPDNATLVLAKNEHQPAAIDVDEKSVYWIAEDRSAIHKVNKAGGAITTVVDDQAGIRRMIVDKDLIYFLTNKEILLGQSEKFSAKTGTFEPAGPRGKFHPFQEQYHFTSVAILVGPACSSACEEEAYGYSRL